MRLLGETLLLVSLVATGYAAFLSVWNALAERRNWQRVAAAAGWIGLGALSVTMGVLAWALVTRDFSFAYVAQYSSAQLPWRYCLSALWVGQAGSLLLWAWMMGMLALALRLLPAADLVLRNKAYGLVMANVCFLIAVLVFAADPMAPSLVTPDEGQGLSPLLQHPSMLVHPPVVFLAYAAWAVPCGLAVAALWLGRLDATWTQMARPWAMLAWSLLGVGLLLGANWAYQELGWGGYWGWDPVENGSLLPWLTGTALIHSLMAWRHRECLKKTAVALAIVTFGLCNFATFLTRSGIFSSVHAFSRSPIGWMFLALMALLLIGGMVLVLRRRQQLTAQRAVTSLLARETLILVASLLLLMLAAVVMIGTLIGPLSKPVVGRTVQLGPAFYNNVLVPVGLGLLAITAMVPLLPWGGAPPPGRRRQLAVCWGVGLAAAVVAWAFGVRHPISLAVAGLAALAACALAVAWWQDARTLASGTWWRNLVGVLGTRRRRYAAYVIHLGFVCVAIGVTGSSLGTQRHEVTMAEGDTIHWAGRDIRYVSLDQHHDPEKFVAEAVLEVCRDGGPTVELRPARHLYTLQSEWTTEVAIDSTWGGDFYTVLHGGLGDGRVALTLVDNPLIRWMWLGGVVITAGTAVAMWPARRRSQTAAGRGEKSAATQRCEPPRANAA